MAYNFILKGRYSVDLINTNAITIADTPAADLTNTCAKTEDNYLQFLNPYLFPLKIEVDRGAADRIDTWEFNLSLFKYQITNDSYAIAQQQLSPDAKLNIHQTQDTGIHYINLPSLYSSYNANYFTLKRNVYIHPYCLTTREGLQSKILTYNSSVIKDNNNALSLFTPIYTEDDWSINNDDMSLAVAHLKVTAIQGETTDCSIITNFNDGTINYRPLILAQPDQQVSSSWRVGDWSEFELLCLTTLYWGDQPTKLLTNSNLKPLQQQNTTNLLTMNSENSNVWTLVKPPLLGIGKLEIVCLIDSDNNASNNYTITRAGNNGTADIVTLNNGKNIKRIYAWYLADDD